MLDTQKRVYNAALALDCLGEAGDTGVKLSGSPSTGCGTGR